MVRSDRPHIEPWFVPSSSHSHLPHFKIHRHNHVMSSFQCQFRYGHRLVNGGLWSGLGLHGSSAVFGYVLRTYSGLDVDGCFWLVAVVGLLGICLIFFRSLRLKFEDYIMLRLSWSEDEGFRVVLEPKKKASASQPASQPLNGRRCALLARLLSACLLYLLDSTGTIIKARQVNDSAQKNNLQSSISIRSLLAHYDCVRRRFE